MPLLVVPSTGSSPVEANVCPAAEMRVGVPSGAMLPSASVKSTSIVAT